MEFDKNEDSQEIHEKISDKSADPCIKAVENKDWSSPKVESGQDSCMEDNALYDRSDNFGNAEAPTSEHPLSSDHSSDLNLPSTVTVLDTDWGSRVYVVGTIHFSPESQEDVAKTIRAIQPNKVVLELCRSRMPMLMMDERTLFEETSKISFRKIKWAFKQFGFVQGLMYIMFLKRTAHVTKELGMAPGGELRRALKEARLVPKCKVLLGDRGYPITFGRLCLTLSFFQKLKLIWHLFTSTGHVRREQLEKYKQMEFLEEFLTMERREYPDLTRVFVEERDIFLANYLKCAARPIRLATGLSNPTVVGVVGIGHIPGIVDAWKQNEYDIRSITTLPVKSQSTTFWGIGIRVGFIGLASYGCFHLYKLTRK